jgi:hypothetical protein
VGYDRWQYYEEMTGHLELPARPGRTGAQARFPAGDVLDYWPDVATAAQGAARFSFMATG